MADPRFLFLSAPQLPQFKQGYVGFDTFNQLIDPFLTNRRIYHPPKRIEPMSDREFEQSLKRYYDAMDETMRGMVSWPYYLEQAKKNREKIEAQLHLPSQEQDVCFPNRAVYQKLCCLRVFQGLHQDSLWQFYGDNHQGIAVLLNDDHDFFTAATYANQPQMYRSILYDDRRPSKPTKESPFPALLQRARHWQFEGEWRLLRPLGAADKEGAYFKLPNGVVQGVCLGINAPASLVREVRQLVQHDLNFRRIRILHMGVSERYLRLVPMPIEDRAP